MDIKKIEHNFSVCKVSDYSLVNFDSEYVFIGKTDNENSLVSITEDVPITAICREDNWKGFRIEGVLDFSLVGVLNNISSILADNNISIFAVSTYNKDYIFVKSKDYEKALDLLIKNGYNIL